MALRHLLPAIGLTLALFAHPGSAAQPIRIGMFAELTGANSHNGAAAVNGARLALAEINAAGGLLGQPLELLVEDNQSTNPGSELAVSRLLSSDVKAIVGTSRSTQILAVMPAIAMAGVPMLVCAAADVVTRLGNPWIFRQAYNDSLLARAIADYGVNTLHAKSWAIVHSEESFGIGARDVLVRELEKLGVRQLRVQGVNNMAQNLAPAVHALQGTDVQVVAALLARPPMYASLAVQLRAAGLQAPLIGGTGLSARTSLEGAGPALWGAYSINPFAVEATEQSRDFARKYRSRTGGEPDQHAAWAYDAVRLFAAAIAQARSAEPQAVRGALRSMRGWQGAAGAYAFDERGDGMHEVNLVRNDQGRLAIIKRIAFPKQ